MQLRQTYKLFVFLTLVFQFQIIQAQIVEPNNLDTTRLGQTDSVLVAATDSVSAKQSSIKEPVTYSAKDSMMFSMPKRKIFMYGESKVKSEGIELESAHIEVDFDEDYVFAEGMIDTTTGEVFGDPFFKDGKDEFVAKSIKYNFVTKKGLVTDVITEQAEGYLHGELTKMYPNKHVHIKNGKYTTCDHDPPHYYIKLTKAKVIPGEKIVSGPLYMVIADVYTPLVLPFGYFPSQSENTSGILMPTYGEEKRRGFFLKGLGYYWAINDNMNLAVTGDYYTYGSWGVNMGANFKKRYKYSGNLIASYQRNAESFKGLSDYSDARSFWIRAGYSQDSKANPFSTFSANLNFGTSNYRELNSTTVEDLTNSTTSSSVSYRRSFPNTPFNLTASANATQNTLTKSISMSAPTVALSMNKVYPLKKFAKKNKFVKNLNFNTNVNFNNTLSVGDSILFTPKALDEMQYGLKYTLPVSSSFTLLDYLTFSPNFSYTGRVYPNYINKRFIPNSTNTADSLVTDTLNQLTHVFDFNTGISMSTALYGMVDFKKGPIKALRHVVKPSVSFSYRPDFSDPRWGFYQLDPADTINYERRYSETANGIFGTPSGGKSGSLSFSLGNTFEMKTRNLKDSTKNNQKISLLQALNFSTSYNLSADSLKWSAISVQARTTIFKKVNLNLSSGFDPYVVDDSTGITLNKFEMTENGRIARFQNARLTVSGGIDQNTFMNENRKARRDALNQNTNYAPFDLPWSVSINYSLAYLKNRYNTIIKDFDSDITQTLSTGFQITPTKKISLGINTGYDFDAQEFTSTTFSIRRDLHCWQMSFSAVPFGRLQSYSFRINVKSSIFEGLEYKREQRFSDYGY